jgi:ribosomal protein S16
MKNITLNIPFHSLTLSEAGEILTPLFKVVSNDSNLYREGRIHESLTEIYSPLTNALYVIRLIKKINKLGQWYAHGIQLEFSPPLVTVGNDYLLVNDDDLAGKVAQLLIMNFAKVCGLPTSSVLYFNMGKAELVSATLSFLVPFSSHVDATSAVEQLRERAAALHNFGWQAHYGAFGQLLPFNGNTCDGFWKFGDDGCHMHFYAIGDTDLYSESRFDASFHNKPIIELPSGYIEASKCFVKFDLLLTQKWFDKKGSDYRYIFNDFPKNIDYKAKEIVNRLFSVNRKFRQKILTNDEVSLHYDFVEGLLTSYFAGENVLVMPQFQMNSRIGGGYPEIRRMLIKHWRIDISVPWKLHKSVLAKNVKTLLKFADDFELTTQHRMSVFCDESATKFLPELERLVSQVKAT